MIVSRAKLGLAPPKYKRELATDYNGWFWHWLGTAYPEHMTEEQMILSAQRYHMGTKGWSDIAYSFAVGRSGKTYELRGWDVAGGHTKGYNNTSHAIVFLIGDGQTPTAAQFQAAWKLVAQRPGMVRSHRDVGQTACPGNVIAGEVKNPQFNKENTMTPSAAEATIEMLYKDLLGRDADKGGLAFWSKSLVNRGHTVDQVRWEFVKTRLAADRVFVRVPAAEVSGDSRHRAETLPTPEAIAQAAYELFLDDLVALR